MNLAEALEVLRKQHAWLTAYPNVSACQPAGFATALDKVCECVPELVAALIATDSADRNADDMRRAALTKANTP